MTTDDDGSGVFAVLMETKTQGPILMETEGPDSSREAAFKRRDALLARPDTIRACVVRIVPDRWGGNDALIHAMRGMQK